MSAPAPRAADAAAKRDILIIEDERGLVRLIRRMLERDGHKVLSAGSAESGLQLARESAPALVILDIELPAMNGISFLRILRRESAVPVILLSGRSSDVDRILGLKAGADDYISKPFSLAELAARVACHLRRANGGVKKRRPSRS